VIVGPTAAGKTGLVTALATRHPIEVVSLDSRQIYRGLRIGTAQPTAAERELCRHHLIDFLDPRESYSAARYRDDFERCFEDIAGRSRLAVVVGGAGMYLTALREGFLPLPPDPDGSRLAGVRSDLDRLTDDEIRALLAFEDPGSHAQIPPADRYRSQRALEITRLAGRPRSELVAEHEPRPALGLTFPTFVLERPVAELDARILRRTTAMLAAGWLAEVEDLVEHYPADCPGLQSLGYRDAVAHLRGAIDHGALVERVVRSTRQFAKRQRTWFRRVDAVGRGSPDDPALLEAVERIIEDAGRSG
jgi:tRNA dimethylallyltransferase